MIHSDEEYEHHHDDLPALKELLQVVDWDVVCVFDACRWDAFNEICDDSDAVRSPGSNTPTWTQDVWCDPALDWSDVTYVSGNPLTTRIRDQDKWGGVLEDHVGEYVEPWKDSYEEDVWGNYLATSKPHELSEVAKQYEPPIVIHYMQPHTPFIGEVSLRVDGVMEEFPIGDFEDFEWQTDQEYYMVEKGMVSPEYARLAYLKNVELVWESTRHIRRRFEKVITTADHGEKLGPDTWDHGGPRSPQGRVVPFHTNTDFIETDELPDPVELGASEDFEWSVI